MSENEYCPQEYRKQIFVHEYLQEQIKLRGLSKKQLLVSLDISESVGYKYLDGTRFVPRDVFLKFLIAFELDINTIQYILQNFGYATLYIRNKRDSALLHALFNNYNYLQIKEYFQKYDISKLWC